MRFSATATGPETGGLDGGRYTIALGRSASNLSLRLTARRVVSFTSSPGIAVFAGKSTGGTVSVKDTLVKRDRGGRVVVSRKVIATARPLIVSAAVFLDTVRCLYEAQVSFVVRTPKGSVTGTAYSEREPIPSGLKLIGGAGPQAYLTCPGNPLLSGKTCYELGGGLAVAYAELEQCKQDPPPGRCVPQDSRPLGDASMNWVLKPTFATK